MELEAELKRHCVANASPFVPKVGEPCCAMFPGETVAVHSVSSPDPCRQAEMAGFRCLGIYFFCFVFLSRQQRMASCYGNGAI